MRALIDRVLTCLPEEVVAHIRMHLAHWAPPPRKLGPQDMGPSG
jgi:hypothetical protein